MATRNPSQHPTRASAASATGAAGLATARRLPPEPAFVTRAAPAGPLQVTLERASVPPTEDQALWIAIRNRTDAIGFDRYAAFIDRLLCEGKDEGAATCGGPVSTSDDTSPEPSAGQFGAPSMNARLQDLRHRPSIYGVDAYQLLRIATHAFLLFEGGVAITPARNIATGNYPPGSGQEEMPGEESRLGRPITFAQARTQLADYLRNQIGNIGGNGLPYLKRIVDALLDSGSRVEGSPFCEGTLRNRLHCPAMIELLWSFWQEQGWLVQSMNAIELRFQNRRRGPNDPLANLALDPIRPFANLMWGFVQDRDRLSVARRSLEYSYAYGFELEGKAVEGVLPVESRTKFIEAFHTLLYRAAQFYAEDAITTVRADGFTLLQALKDVHLEMAEGYNNQADDLKRTARAEMLTMQWLFARPEMREFLRGRAMVPYREKWMGQVDTMKRLLGGPDVSVTHFRELADSGEKVCLAVRYGDWIAVNDQTQALNWARYFKPEIQAYLHAYQAVTGVDLAAEMTDTRRSQDRYVQPSVHLRQRSIAARSQAALAAPQRSAGFIAAELVDDSEVPARAALLRHRNGL
jgi:hypothetical protein